MPDTEDDREGADVRWVSYDELASIRGIDKASAFRMAHRRRWPKRKGNDGTVRLAVPASDLQARARVDPDVRSDGLADVRFEKSTTISVLQGLIAAKDAQIEALHGGWRQRRGVRTEPKNGPSGQRTGHTGPSNG